MAYLIDTSVLGRLANTAALSHPIALRAVVEMHRRGEVLHVTPQNLIGFRNAATGPTAVKGQIAGLEELDEKPRRWTSRPRCRLYEHHANENDSRPAWLTHILPFR